MESINSPKAVRPAEGAEGGVMDKIKSDAAGVDLPDEGQKNG